MKAAYPFIDDFLPAGTLASLERLGEVLAGASATSLRWGVAQTRATSVTPSLGLVAPDAEPPRPLTDPIANPTAARPLT
jgi:hypothetical protein